MIRRQVAPSRLSPSRLAPKARRSQRRPWAPRIRAVPSRSPGAWRLAPGCRLVSPSPRSRLPAGSRVPLHLSADVWAYAAYGALLGHGVDPWAHAYTAVDVARYPRSAARWRAARLGRLPAARRLRPRLHVRDRAGRRGDAVVAAGRDDLRAARAGGARAAGVHLPRPAQAARLARLLALHPSSCGAPPEGHNDAFWLALVLLADHLRSVPARLTALVAAGAVKRSPSSRWARPCWAAAGRSRRRWRRSP